MALMEGNIVRPGIYMRYENIGPYPPKTPKYHSGGGSVVIPPSEEPETTIDAAAFDTLAAAFENAADGATIVLTVDRDIKEPLKIPEEKTVTLRIPAGVTLGVDAGTSNYGMVVKGDLTIEGDGEIVLSGYGFGTSMNTDSKLTIKGGTFKANGCDYIIGCFDGEIVIEGGTFLGEYCVVNNFSDYYKTDGKVTITGGLFTTSAEESYDVLGSPVAISGGQFSKPVDASHCAEGYTPATTPDEDGFYTVA